MKKIALLLCLLLVTGCGKKEEDEGVKFDNAYEQTYYDAVEHLKKLLTYEYDMTVENTTSSGTNATVTNVQFNKQGGFVALKDTISKTKAPGATDYLETPLTGYQYYIDYQYDRFVSYDLACNRWEYNKVTLTDDSAYGPYLQILTLTPVEKITKNDGETFFLEVDSATVADAFTNSLDQYSGNIKIEVKIVDGKFKNGIITLDEFNGTQKTISFEFKAYSNVEVFMDTGAANAKQYLGDGC